MSLISQRETSINLVSTYTITAVRSMAAFDRWFASNLLHSNIVIRRIQAENSSGRNSEGAGTIEIDPEIAAKGLSGRIQNHDADYVYFYLTYQNVNITASIHITDWSITLVGKKRFSSQLQDLATLLKLNEN